MVDGVLAGEERAMYPGGEAGRAAEIDAGAGRPAAELLEDFRTSAQALDGAWNRVPDDAWSGTGITLFARTRADLDDGVEPLPRAARAPRGSRPRLWSRRPSRRVRGTRRRLASRATRPSYLARRALGLSRQCASERSLGIAKAIELPSGSLIITVSTRSFRAGSGLEVNPDVVQRAGDLVDVTHDDGAGPGARALGELVDLQSAAAFELPFDDLGHRVGSRARESARTTVRRARDRAPRGLPVHS